MDGYISMNAPTAPWPLVHPTIGVLARFMALLRHVPTGTSAVFVPDPTQIASDGPRVQYDGAAVGVTLSHEPQLLARLI